MKTKILFTGLAIVLLSAFGFAQKIEQGKVPSAIVSNFEKDHPRAKDIEWERDGDNYKVEFEIGDSKQDHISWYNSEGNLIKHKMEISYNQLPVKVAAKLESDFADFKTDDIYKIDEGGKTKYKVELKNGKEELKVVFDENGNLLKK